MQLATKLSEVLQARAHGWPTAQSSDGEASCVQEMSRIYLRSLISSTGEERHDGEVGNRRAT